MFAGVGVFGIAGYGHFVLIATSDPLMTTLCLAAIDAHLSGRRRLAWALLVLTSLGRPEAWVVTAAYALWAWRSEPALRTSLVVGLAALPLLWFGIPTITSGNPLIAGKIEAESTYALHGNRVTGTSTALPASTSCRCGSPQPPRCCLRPSVASEPGSC